MPDPLPSPTPHEISDTVAEEFFGVAGGASAHARRTAVWQWLTGAVESAVLVPLVFSLRFGEVGVLGWGTTVFFVVYCLLVALGLHVRPRTDLHTRVPLRGDWVDHVGAYWLVACAFGPLVGWAVTSAVPVTETSWQSLYGLRAVLAAGLPLVTALALSRYARGKAAWVAVPLLVGVTLLPVLTAVPVTQDLWEGPAVQQAQPGGEPTLYLRHTERTLR